MSRAVVFTAPRSVELREVALPVPGAHDLVVELDTTAISAGTERWALLGLRPDVGWPCIPGYLSVGRVASVGAAARGFAAGARVCFMSGRIPAGHDSGGNWMAAHMSRTVLCCDPACHVREADLPYWLPVPDGVDSACAAYAGLAAVSYQGVKMAGVGAGEAVAVFGLGMVGQMAAQLAAIAGARVAACDRAPARVALAAEGGGVESAVDSSRTGWEAELRAAAPAGFDVVIDTTGSADAVNAAAAFLRPHGRFVMQGWYPGLTGLNVHEFTIRQTRMFFPCAVRGGDVARVLELMTAGRLRAGHLIGRRWKPEDAPEAYRLLLEDPGGAPVGQVFEWAP